MAELNQTPGRTSGRKIRSRKLNSKVDLTAMVDLAFLLITFFMLTTSLSKPKAMNTILPDDSDISMPVDENRTMTILIGSDNKAFCYMGKPDGQTPKEITLHTRAFRDEIAKNEKEAIAYSIAKGKPDQGLIVIIKPSKQSNFGNLVDVLDEMAIADIASYAIVDPDKKEKDLLGMR